VSRGTSTFLDFLRLAAAFTVFFAHTSHFWNPAMLGPMQVAAHDAVIVFFVLSGYVIAFTTREGRRDPREYTLARLSRLCSVTIPALVLTFLLWKAGRELGDPAIYVHYERAHWELRYALTATFMNEIWFLDAYPPTNTPFWSLGYEFWYYVLFGVVLFVRAGRARVVALVVCAALAGPKVLLLLPVWLVGVAAYVWRDRWTLPPAASATGFIVSLAGTSAALRWLPEWPSSAGGHPWYFSGAAATDLICGCGWALTIWFFNQLARGWTVPNVVYRVVRWSANHTFSLYLYHAPLVIFATAMVPLVHLDRVAAVVVISTILLVVFALGAATESQRHRWRALFAWFWDRFFRPRAVSAA
jgi:peptidoglycan/LPS O-acetylase OafA/YrhL